MSGKVPEFLVYFTAIYDGTIVACEKMRRISEILLERHRKPGRWHYDQKYADRHTDFIERFCCLPAGQLGVPFKLELFQKARLQAIFGFVDDDGLRQYNEVMIIEGRKNGKTSECAAVELDMLCNDGEGAPHVFNVATKYDQAAIAFGAAQNMRQQSPALRANIYKRKKDLYFPTNMGYIMPLSSQTSSLDGLDASCAVVDELAAIRNRDLYDLVKQSGSARRQPLMFTISTNGFVRQNIFDAQYEFAEKVLKNPDEGENARFLPLIYELDKGDDWQDESVWIKANPGLGTVKKWETLRGYVDKAKKDPHFLPTVLVKDFNRPQTSESSWLTYEEANNDDRWDISFDYGIGGFDAADTIDLNAATALFMRPNDPHIYRASMYWIPQRVIDEQQKRGDRKERDSVPYELWIQQGYLRTCEGARVNKRVILDWFCELRDEKGYIMRKIGYDPWHIDDTLKAAFAQEFGDECLVPIRQGAKTLSQPMKNAKADFSEHLIVYNANPIDKWCLMNTVVKKDINDNWQPVKLADQNHRIDGTAAFLCAYTVLENNKDDYINLNTGAGE